MADQMQSLHELFGEGNNQLSINKRRNRKQRIKLAGAATEKPFLEKVLNLRYISDDKPGIRRQKAGRGFTYVDVIGDRLKDAHQLRRIRSLVIPPAWADVWISPMPDSHLQATGRDARGRKQYIYHQQWSSYRNLTKFNRMITFGETLPAIRRRTDEDLRKHGLIREKVLAAVVRLLETTLIRIGNEEYVKLNQSFGLTTMRTRHLEISGSAIVFDFRGKRGKEQSVRVFDRRLAGIVRRCQELPGYELFQYLDGDGTRHAVGSSDVNDYLREISGEDFTAKEFRTWGGTVRTALALAQIGPFSSETEAKKNIVTAVKETSNDLGNTPTICRKYYIHPAILYEYQNGTLINPIRRAAAIQSTDSPHELSPVEKAILRILQNNSIEIS